MGKTNMRSFPFNIDGYMLVYVAMCPRMCCGMSKMNDSIAGSFCKRTAFI
jgi:hypothetical protein